MDSKSRLKRIATQLAEQPDWVCRDCGIKYGRRPNMDRVSCWHNDDCSVCGNFWPVTEPRDFGYVNKEWQEHGRAHMGN